MLRGVADAENRQVGVLTKSDLVTRRRRRVILVDHSERSLSAAGIEQAEILEILDHHRLEGVFLPGVLSHKKQVVPAISRAV